MKKEITGFELTEFIIKSTGTSYDEMISDIPREDVENYGVVGFELTKDF